MPEIDLFAPRGQGGRHPSLADRIDAAGDCWLGTVTIDADGRRQCRTCQRRREKEAQSG